MAETTEIRKNFQDYMTSRSYNLVSPDSLVCDTFPTCFTLSGGPNFVDKYLQKEQHDQEDSVVIQPCHRFWDVDNVGDGRHLSFFEMAVTYSFNGKSREEMFRLHFDFLTKELGLNQDYFTVYVFGGGDCYNASFKPDNEALEIWGKLGLTRFHIQRGFGRSPHHKRLVNSGFVANTVEPVGGPRTEICYGDLEIWTSVLYDTFVDYNKATNEFNFREIGESTTAAGFGLERVIQAVNGLSTIDNVHPIEAPNPVVKDHIRGLVFLAKDSAFDLSGRSNASRKTLLNRYVKSFIHNSGEFNEELIRELIFQTVMVYQESYPDLVGREEEFTEIIKQRVQKLKLL